MQQKVVIIGHSFSSRLSITRSVAQIGCKVTVIVMTGYKRDGMTLNTCKPIDCYSKYVSNVYYCHRRDTEGLIKLLLDKCTDEHQRVILFPDSDDSVVTIDNHKDVLDKFFCFPHICNGSGTIEYWMDKINQKEAARSVGLNVAEGVVVDIHDGKYLIPSTIHYPCYTKPLTTINGGKGGMHCCNDEKELVNAINEYIATRTKTGKVLVEQYKEINTEYALLGFSTEKEVIIPGIMKLLVISKKNKGIALKGKVQPCDGFEETINIFKQLVKKIGFVGVFDIDFFESDGKLYFCEINLRFGGSGYAITKMGVNLPAMYVDFCQNHDYTNHPMTIDGNALYVNERMCLDDWNNSFITTKQFSKYMKAADVRFLPDRYDPLPYYLFYLYFYKRLVIKAIKSIMQ